MTIESKSDDVAVVRAQGITAIAWLIVAGAWSIYHTASPPPGDIRAVNEMFYHPVASLFGGLAVVVVFTPVAYWLGGFMFRRIRSKST